MDIYSSEMFKGHWILLEMRLFIGMRLNTDEKIGQDERKCEEGNREKRKGREGQRFGGQTNKQTTHRFPAVLRHSWGNPLASTIRLHSSPLMLKTLLAGGSPPSSTTPPLPPPPWLIASFGHLPGTVHLR